MGWIPATTGATAAAAAEERRKEEEEMTHYTDEELAGNWEFKIVRSYGEYFKKPENLRRVIEAESRAGWVLVEKFDDERVRFKRPVNARERDHLLEAGVDPYRIRYGPPLGVFLISIFLVIFGVVGLIVLLVSIFT